MQDLDKNYEFFKKNQNEFSRKYANKYVVIADEKVVFNSKNIDDAVEYVKQLEAGTYILQKCETDSEKNIRTFHSRVRFNGETN